VPDEQHHCPAINSAAANCSGLSIFNRQNPREYGVNGSAVYVAQPDNINDPGLQKLAKALNSDEVRQFILTRYKGQIAPGVLSLY
jgi:ABC-type metal ion transport system substrate-binding protein